MWAPLICGYQGTNVGILDKRCDYCQVFVHVLKNSIFPELQCVLGEEDPVLPATSLNTWP